MKQTWELKVISGLFLLIPLAFFPSTFDQFGVPKMTIFILGAWLLFLAVLINFKRLLELPKYLIWAFSLFALVQIWQTFRLPDVSSGIFGAYGQSESLLVQLGFLILSLACCLFIVDEAGRRKIRSTVIITVFLVSVYGIFQYICGDPITKTTITRVKSFLGDPNALGAFLVLTLPVVLWEFKSRYRQWQGYCIAGCFFLGIIALFLSFSRAAWLGLIFGFTPLIYQTIHNFIRNRQLAKRNFVFLLIIFFIVIGGLIAGQILTHFQQASHRDYTLEARVSSITHGNDSGRSLIWSIAWQAFKKSPVSGYGIGSFQTVFHRFEIPAAIKFWGPERDLRQVHNETLHYLSTQGLIGLLSYFGLLFALFAAARITRLFKNSLSFEETAFWSAIIGYLLYVQFNYPLIHYSFLFWCYLGILIGYRNQPEQRKPGNRFKPAILFLAVLFIGAGSYLAANIFRADLYYRKAFFAARCHHYQQSFTSYQSAVSLIPWSYHYRYRYGITLYRAAGWAARHDHDPNLSFRYLLRQAKTILIPLTKRNPDRYEPLFLLGQVAEMLGDLPAADSYYREALRLYPLNYPIIFRLAKISWLKGDKTQFANIFKAGIKLNPAYMQGMLVKEGLLPEDR